MWLITLLMVSWGTTSSAVLVRMPCFAGAASVFMNLPRYSLSSVHTAWRLRRLLRCSMTL